MLQEHSITGWNANEISIKGVKEKYYGFQVLGRCEKLEQPNEAGFYTGYEFEYISWDKSDFFSPDETVLLFCTQKIRDILKKYKITDIELTDISKVQTYSISAT